MVCRWWLWWCRVVVVVGAVMGAAALSHALPRTSHSSSSHLATLMDEAAAGGDLMKEEMSIFTRHTRKHARPMFYINCGYRDLCYCYSKITRHHYCCSCDLGACFPAHARVATPSGSHTPMAHLRTGDQVLAVNDGGAVVTSTVLGFMDRRPQETALYLTLSTSSGLNLTLSPNHVLFKASTSTSPSPSSSSSSRPVSVFGRDVEIGDVIFAANGTEGLQRTEVVAVRHHVTRGAYVPLTREGTLVVDGVFVSCYASYSHPLAHRFLAPVRAFPVLLHLRPGFLGRLASWGKAFVTYYSSAFVSSYGSFVSVAFSSEEGSAAVQESPKIFSSEEKETKFKQLGEIYSYFVNGSDDNDTEFGNETDDYIDDDDGENMHNGNDDVCYDDDGVYDSEGKDNAVDIDSVEKNDDDVDEDNDNNFEKSDIKMIRDEEVNVDNFINCDDNGKACVSEKNYSDVYNDEKMNDNDYNNDGKINDNNADNNDNDGKNIHHLKYVANYYVSDFVNLEKYEPESEKSPDPFSPDEGADDAEEGEGEAYYIAIVKVIGRFMYRSERVATSVWQVRAHVPDEGLLLTSCWGWRWWWGFGAAGGDEGGGDGNSGGGNTRSEDGGGGSSSSNGGKDDGQNSDLSIKGIGSDNDRGKSSGSSSSTSHDSDNDDNNGSDDDGGGRSGTSYNIGIGYIIQSLSKYPYQSLLGALARSW